MSSSSELATLFSDLTPLPQEDGPHPICAIQYPQAFSETMGYFRALLKAEEVSERGLELTSLVIDTNPANYTAWFWRRKCLEATNADLGAELEYTAEVGGTNPKNYQIWYHRRSLLTLLPTTSTTYAAELSYVSTVLLDDSKNYHAWSHRQFLVSTFGAYDDEKRYAKAMIERDGRNNSAWNQLYFCCEKSTQEEGELSFALEQAGKDPHNESPYRFIVGWINLLRSSPSSAGGVAAGGGGGGGGKAEDACREAGTVPALACLVDLLVGRGEREEAREVCKRLEGMDKIREKFWRYK
eukprot:CAMPEP_0182457718 /NCGR_PEP_ID=MMETSP1319-20130603/3226_1 /TAXON_ID=172717 /ORGANISM="Bolidomonas pacifica, Strain RCC208" /LENGTH=296 /DNA_ID=CAMNT_0024656245 /DNA_START=142 /DNA_END=1029 /DNA_ORIENTATION=-